MTCFPRGFSSAVSISSEQRRQDKTHAQQVAAATHGLAAAIYVALDSCCCCCQIAAFLFRGRELEGILQIQEQSEQTQQRFRNRNRFGKLHQCISATWDE